MDRRAGSGAHDRPFLFFIRGRASRAALPISPRCGHYVTFSSLDLRPELAQTVADLGYDAPTPIQAGMIPVLMSGRDAIGQARTGTGKTAAFSLPILHNLDEGSRGHVQALILVPTRELAVQVSSAVYNYGKALGVRALPIYGGQPYHKQIRRLEQGVDVVVATPGRLVDLLTQSAIDLSNVRTVVLDEADEMLSMGFADDLEAILSATPDTRQTALLSATMPGGIKSLSKKHLKNPETVAVGEGDRTAQDVEQRGYVVHGRDKLAAMVRLLEMEDVTSALVFVKTRASTASLAADLTRLGYAAEAISGDLSQGQRTAVLDRFRRQELKILVATDVAARGLDIDHVSHVFNVDLPIDIESYVHRVGRTGRAGRSGIALSLVSPGERGLIQRIQSYVRREIPATSLPTVEEVEARRNERLVEQMVGALETGATDVDRKLVIDLVTEGRDAMEVAAAALAMAREARNDAPLYPIGAPRQFDRPQHSAPRDHRDRRDHNGRGTKPAQGGQNEHGMVRIALNAGRMNGVMPNMVVSAIARTADIPGRELGKIQIQDRTTFVDVPEPLVSRVLAQSGDYRFGKRLASAEVA